MNQFKNLSNWVLSERISSSLLLLTIAIVLTLSGLTQRLDDMLFDKAQRLATRQVPDDVIIVSIDSQSLAELGRWPWSRGHHARLIEQLKNDGAKVIGLDLILAENDSNDSQADHSLAVAMAQAGNVVLPIAMEEIGANGYLFETLPLADLAQQSAALGRVHAELDADAIARSIYLWEGVGSAFWPHFSQSLLTVAQQAHSSTTPMLSTETSGQFFKLYKNQQRWINFVSGNQHFQAISYSQVLKGAFSKGLFKDKIVLVGATAAGISSKLSTPISGLQSPMSGVEFLANAMVSMREGTLIVRAPFWVNALICGILSALPMLWLPLRTARVGLIGSAVYFVAVVVLTMVLPVLFHVWILTSSALLAIVIAYPLWAWRRIEVASKFLDSELLRMRSELRRLDVEVVAWTEPQEKDPLQMRISQVQHTTRLLQRIESEHKEILAFISHDIRMPLVNADLLLSSEAGSPHPAHHNVRKALLWAEEFVQTSHAQMLNPQTFVELDFTALAHQAVDDFYPLAAEKKIILCRHLGNEPTWVHGKFDLLLRAVFNLISNAIKYSIPGATVEIKMQKNDASVFIQIVDTGPGIPPEFMKGLFSRFSRSQEAQQSQPGSGLGLYFVQLVAKKHNGSISVNSQPGQTAFSLSLPRVTLRHQ
jgi:CHASE2 domain-containing sensor protein/two-component sensor histidine kinase